MEYMEWFALVPHVVEYHELFHIMVLIGAWLHFQFVSQFESGLSLTLTPPNLYARSECCPPRRGDQETAGVRVGEHDQGTGRK